MKEIRIKLYLGILLLSGFIFTSCEEDRENDVLDVNNLEETIAQLNGGSILIFNPAEETSNIVTVGVSTVSNQDRSFTIAIDEDKTTLDASFYIIPSLTGTIPAGSFIGDLEIITPIPTTLPASGLVLTIDLVSVEGATILETSLSEESIPITVACPDVELANVVGAAVTLENPLLEAFGVPATFSDPRVVVAGPEENQITIIGGLSADVGGTDIVLTIDPETGVVTDAVDGGVSFVNGGTPIPTTGISGRVLTCINQISINVDNSTFAPPFNSLALTLEIQ